MLKMSWEQLLGSDFTLYDENTPFIIFAPKDAQLCKDVLTVLSARHDKVRLFDNDDLSIPDSEKELSVVVMASDSQELNAESMVMFEKFGFHNCCNGHEVLEIYQRKKIYSDYVAYQEQNTDERFEITESNSQIVIDEWHRDAGISMAGRYFVQDLWGAQKVFDSQPQRHYDIGSSVSGFIAHLLAVKMPTVMIDVRPLETYGTEFISFIHEDATLLSGIPDQSIESLSALCSLEHFGLGRYGDPVDPAAHTKAFKNIQRVMKKGGNVYISLPVQQKCSLQFNTHRIYTPYYITEQFDSMTLMEFSLCAPEGLVKHAPLGLEDCIKENEYMFGLFHFRR
jgi:hypothetical protein